MTPETSDADRPDIEKEFRFAVVMHGGVSLAIYINRMVKALIFPGNQTLR